MACSTVIGIFLSPETARLCLAIKRHWALTQPNLKVTPQPISKSWCLSGKQVATEMEPRKFSETLFLGSVSPRPKSISLSSYDSRETLPSPWHLCLAESNSSSKTQLRNHCHATVVFKGPDSVLLKEQW